MEHEPYPEPGYETRTSRAFTPPRHGLPFHRERPREPQPSGKARYCASQIPDRGLCSRVLLAPPQRMQRHYHPEDPDGMVGGEVCGERGEGSAESEIASEIRVASGGDMGLRNREP